MVAARSSGKVLSIEDAMRVYMITIALKARMGVNGWRAVIDIHIIRSSMDAQDAVRWVDTAVCMLTK